MRNRLSAGLIDVARLLTAVRRPPIAKEQAAFRRAASSAYYALFHTICQLCGEGLGLWSVGGDDLQAAYRAVDHGRAADVLTAGATRSIHPDVVKIGQAFVELRAFREDADYSQPGRLGAYDKLLTSREIETLIALSESAIALVDELPQPVRRRLAVLLLTGLNKRQAGPRRR